jgi:sarcosine oxidase subunit gamma
VTVDGRARSPLARRAEDLRRARDNTRRAVVIAELPLLAQIDVRVAPQEAGGAPYSLPREPNTVSVTGEVEVLWLGPDEWLAVGPPGSAHEIQSSLAGALRRVHHSIVDVSANRAVLELSGPGGHGLLAKGCALDLAPPAWVAGRCAQTLLGRVGVILQERSDATRVFVRPSFGDYLVDWLLDATEEYRITGAAP